MHIHPFERPYLEPCVALFLTVFTRPPWNEDWAMTTAAARFTDLLHTPGFYGVIAIDATEMVGFAAGYTEHWARTQHFYLKELCVAPQHQRQGIGTTLLQTICTELAARGVERISLLTSRVSPAEDFYRKRGFYVSQKMVMMGKSLKE